jgi:hypothetical protein
VHADRCYRREPYGERFQNPRREVESVRYLMRIAFWSDCVCDWMFEGANKQKPQENTTQKLVVCKILHSMHFVPSRYTVLSHRVILLGIISRAT